MARLLSPLSIELRALRGKLDFHLTTHRPLTRGEVERMVQNLRLMEEEAAALENRPTVEVSERSLELARRLEAAGIVP